MIKYPGGVPYKPVTKKPTIGQTSASNRGMSLENDLNLSNEYYNDSGIALITKRPTPINVVKVDYSKGARIVDAYFEKQSTTDYNGIYKGRYLDMEAKSTLSKNSFPLSNVYEHQLEHLTRVLAQNGLALFIIRFASLDETYLIEAKHIIEVKTSGKRRSVPLQLIRQHGILIENGYAPRIDYLKALDQLLARR